jgi:hypothetical protein
MSKKKGFRTALATILIVFVIFAALTFAAIKYFLPLYQISQSEVYSWAVKIFPLLIGITLIVIASMLGKDDSEDVSEEDKLPPNAYEQQLFEKPADDPSKKEKVAQPVAQQPIAPMPEKAPAFFVSIFDQEEPEEPVVENVFEEAAQEPEPEPVPEPVAEPETEAEVETEPETEPEAKPEVEETTEPIAEPAPVEPKEDPNKPLVEAIMALVDKMDDFTSAVIYGSEEEEDYEDEEEEPEEIVEEDEQEAEEPSEEEPENDYEEHFARIEDQISSLAATVEKLAEEVKNVTTPVIVAAPESEAEPQPVVEEAPAPEPEPEPVEEPVSEPVVEPTPAPQPVDPGTIVVDASATKNYKEYEGSAAKQATQAEFDSAKDFGYDLNVAKVNAPSADVTLLLGDAGQCIDNGDTTIVVIPFASSDEAKETLDKMGSSYELRTVAAGSNQSFEDLAKDWLN